jgi:flavin reductase (DIM6/NTAB) family NADH-FMN oxidoreductase RutF
MPGGNSTEFRGALGRFASGVTVITVRHEDHTHGMTANAFVSVSLDPPLVLVSLDNRSRLRGIIPEVGRFGISVLSEDQEAFSDHFAGRKVEDLTVAFATQHDVPLIEGAVAHFVVESVDVHPAGDHTLFIARVEYYAARDGRPLVFYGGKYQRLRVEKKSQWPEDEFSLFSIGKMGDIEWPR